MQQGSQGSKRRRIKLVDKKWQLPLVLGIGCSAFACGLLLLIANFLLSDPDTLDGLSSKETAQIVLCVDIGFVLVVSVMLVLVTLRITNSVSGPAMMIERAVEALRAGRFDSRLDLRKGDYMKGLAGSVQQLSEDFSRRRTTLSRTAADLQRALKDGDTKVASALALELHTLIEKPLASGATRSESTVEASTGGPAAPLPTAAGTPAHTPHHADHSSAKSLAARTPHHGKQSGFTILETLMGLVLLIFGVGVAVVTGLRCANLQRTTDALVQAHNAGRDVIERCQTGGLLAKLQQYSAQPDHPSGELQIHVQFPTDALIAGFNGTIPATSRFSDVDGDGTLELNEFATDTVGLLPVRITANRAGFKYHMDALIVGP